MYLGEMQLEDAEFASYSKSNYSTLENNVQTEKGNYLQDDINL